jgi:hypothetical protein
VLQWEMNGEAGGFWVEVPDPVPISLVDLIRGTLRDPESGGIYHNFGPSGNDWDVGAFGGAGTPTLFNYKGNAPADVLAAFPSASPQLISLVIDPDSPLNNQGGSDFSNLLLGASFVTGGALLTGGPSLFSTVFDSISNAVSSVFTAAPEAVAWGALDAGPAAILVDAAAAAAYGAVNAATVAALTIPVVAESVVPWGALDAGPAAIPVDAAAAAAYGAVNAATVAALTIPVVAQSVVPWGALDAGPAAIPVDATAAAAYGAVNAATVAATVGGLTLATAKELAGIATSAAGLAKATAGVAAAGAMAAHPMAAFSDPLVLGNGSDALPGDTAPAAPAAPAAGTSNYAAFAIAGVALLGIYVFIVRKQ